MSEASVVSCHESITKDQRKLTLGNYKLTISELCPFRQQIAATDIAWNVGCIACLTEHNIFYSHARQQTQQHPN